MRALDGTRQQLEGAWMLYSAMGSHPFHQYHVSGVPKARDALQKLTIQDIMNDDSLTPKIKNFKMSGGIFVGKITGLMPVTELDHSVQM